MGFHDSRTTCLLRFTITHSCYISDHASVRSNPFPLTFLFLEEELQEVLHHGGPHGADAVVALQHGEGDSTAGDAIPVEEFQDLGGVRPQAIFGLGEYVDKS